MLRKLIAVGALVLATMCLTAPAAYAYSDVGHVLDEPVTIDHGLALNDFAVTAIDSAVDLTVPIVANLLGFGEADEAGDVPIAAFCPVALRLLAGDPMRIDDPGWCRS